MNKQLAAFFLLLALSTSALAQAAPPLTAADRVRNLANEESAWRWGSGLTKLIVGGAVTAAGYSLFSVRDNFFAALACIPLGATIMVPGVLVMGWGGLDLMLGSREYEGQYDKLKLASDADRENQAVTYLKDKSEKDYQGRQPSFWNGFGLFSMFDTPAEREYKGYLKDAGGTK